MATTAPNKARKRPDWPAIRAAFEVSTTSIRALARRHGVSHEGIRKRAQAETWQRTPRTEEAQQQAAAPPPPPPAPAAADLAALADRGRDLAGRLLDELSAISASVGQIEQAVDAETADDGDGRRRRAMLRALGLPARVVMLKDLATTLRTLAGAAPGKKAAAADAARRASSGRLATPRTPPRLVINNGAKP